MFYSWDKFGHGKNFEHGSVGMMAPCKQRHYSELALQVISCPHMSRHIIACIDISLRYHVMSACQKKAGLSCLRGAAVTLWSLIQCRLFLQTSRSSSVLLASFISEPHARRNVGPLLRFAHTRSPDSVFAVHEGFLARPAFGGRHGQVCAFKQPASNARPIKRETKGVAHNQSNGSFRAGPPRRSASLPL